VTVLKRPLTLDDVLVELYPQDEDETPRQADSAMSIAESESYAAAVEEMLAEAPIWGWCVAVVKVEWGAFEEKQYLGNCSYRSADDFRENSGYYDDMVKEALSELNSTIELTVGDLRKMGCI